MQDSPDYTPFKQKSQKQPGSPASFQLYTEYACLSDRKKVKKACGQQQPLWSPLVLCIGLFLSLSVLSNSATLWSAACQAPL